MKAGYQTTEFYTALATLAVAALTALGVTAPDDERALLPALVALFKAIAALLTAGAVVIQYIGARTRLKQAALARENG